MGVFALCRFLQGCAGLLTGFSCHSVPTVEWVERDRLDSCHKKPSHAPGDTRGMVQGAQTLVYLLVGTRIGAMLLLLTRTLRRSSMNAIAARYEGFSLQRWAFFTPGSKSSATSSRGRASLLHRRHLLELLQPRIQKVPLIPPHGIRDDLRLVPPRIIQARRMHREDLRHGRKGHVHGRAAGRAERAGLDVAAVADHVPQRGVAAVLHAGARKGEVRAVAGAALALAVAALAVVLEDGLGRDLVAYGAASAAAGVCVGHLVGPFEGRGSQSSRAGRWGGSNKFVASRLGQSGGCNAKELSIQRLLR